MKLYVFPEPLQPKAISDTCVLTSPLPAGTEVKNPPANAGDPNWIHGLRRSLGVRNGNPLQYSSLGNPTDRGAWWATVHGVAKSRTRLSD